ncbi:methyl-accepting chemotaxis protein [Deinococcus sp. VB343]|uniref:methyl-accepting chemotaxis protein n=1 Tax=Deinococcus sp. VB343 TaxID=3385567 RepID=UPI0039C9F349
MPLAVTVTSLGTQAWNEYRAANRQIQIASNYGALEQLQLQLREIRGSAPAQVQPEQVQKLQQVAQELSQALSRPDAATSQQLSLALDAKIGNIAEAIRTGSVNAAQLATLINSALDTELARLFRTLADEGQLSTVGTAGGGPLVRLTSETMAHNLPEVGRMFTTILPILDTALAAQGGVLTGEQRADIRNAVARARQLTDEIERDGASVLSARPDLRPTLAQPYAVATQQTRDLFDFVEERTLKPQQVTTTFQQLLDVANPTLPAQYRAFDLTTQALRQVFTQQRDQAKTKLILLALLTLVLAAVIVTLLRAVTASILQPLRHLTRASQHLSNGDFDVKVPVRSRDELGVLGQSFNRAADLLRQNQLKTEKERREAQQLQHNIGEFLDVTVDIAGGDLTRRGNVTEDVLGNVVDSINLMAEELAGTLRQVQQASQSVTNGSQQMLGTAEEIEQGSRLTTEQAQRLAARAQEMNLRIRDMTLSAEASADAAQQALETSRQGQEAMRGTLAGIRVIREGTQDVATSMTTLTEHSRQIQNVVDTITQISSQINLLSLHASIEAAGAGAAGGRFAIVADSVRKLANTSAEATTRIAGLIKAVQQEVQSVIADTEEGTREVEQGYRIASTAGERLQEIGQLTEQSARFAETVAASTRQQASGVEQVGAAVQQIAGVAEQAQTAAQQLEALAQQLDQSLARFRLPD